MSTSTQIQSGSTGPMQIAYILSLIGIVVPLTAVIGGLIAVFSSGSHARYLSGVFWTYLIVGVIGSLLIPYSIGYFVLFALWVWYAYKTITGFIAFNSTRTL